MMKAGAAIRKVREKGAVGVARSVMHKAGLVNAKDDDALKILLLTNRDSDNLGDLVIEACDISLIRTVMKNLNIPVWKYEIISRAAGIVKKEYVATGDPELLKGAEKQIMESDVVFFGGAPLFNYKYQIFYERTAVTLELAQKYSRPVIFSAIGVEGYDEDDPKCQRLKKTLNFDCVKQITTRDDFDSLQKYLENGTVRIGKVADPAVYTKEAFAKYVQSPKKNPEIGRKIGLFVLRSGGFKSNGIDFSRAEAADLWLSVIDELQKRGYDYTLLTSGHFGDEAFLDYLIRERGVDSTKCRFDLDSPEKLVRDISMFDAVVSCRLHPSIISYSLGVPAIGIVWNQKVAQFYEAIGYPDRTMTPENASPAAIVNLLEAAMDEGVEQDESFRMSVYQSVFDALKIILRERGLLKKDAVCYSPEELKRNMNLFSGTSRKDKDAYTVRKLRRTYENYNKNMGANAAKTGLFSLLLKSGTKAAKLTCDYDERMGDLRHLKSGTSEYRLHKKYRNSGRVCMPENRFACPGCAFAGWHLRVKNAGVWYWYLQDGRWKPEGALDQKDKKGLIADCARIPVIQLHDLDVLVAEAVWKRSEEPDMACVSEE